MRGVVGLVMGGCLLASAWAAAGEPLVIRYRIPANYEKYPQDTPAKALASVVKAVELGQIEYLLAHLADPAFVDRRVDEYKAQHSHLVKEKAREDGRILLAFERLTNETRDHFKGEPGLVKELQRFAQKGEWETKDGIAVAQLKSIPTRRVFMKEIQKRWYLEDRQR
jgi:hypothetical protein